MTEAMKTLINTIKFPTTNVYYEKDSADGFALLGYAREKVGLPSKRCFDAVAKRNYTLNASKKAKETSITKGIRAVYTSWTCIEFFKLLGNVNEISKVVVFSFIIICQIDFS